jgi:GH3 auxin-responsive promoter
MSLFGLLRPYRTLRLAARASAARALRAHVRARDTQERMLARIVSMYRSTALGRSLGLSEVRSIDDFRRRVPVTEKKDYRSWVERLKKENPRGLVTKDKLEYLAVTSGTSDEVQLFPFPHPLIATFRRFQWEIMLHIMDQLGNYAILDTNILVTAPAATYETLPSGLVAGKATAIMTQLTPKAARGLVRPPREILAMTNVDQKLEATVEDALGRDIRVVTGVPLCVLPLFERLIEGARARGRSGATLAEIWPNLAAYGFSGAAIGSLEPRLRQLAGPNVPFFEIYSASESPVAYQLRRGEPGLLLDLRHCFFEFQRAGEPLDAPRFTVDEVEPRTPYRILLTTLGGRFCYRLGDVVEFSSVTPYVLSILGREHEELNLGYERIPLHLVRAALERASREGGARVHNFFVCPTATSDVRPAHEWHVEFAEPPRSEDEFRAALDRALHELHGRYAFARKGLLNPPALVAMPQGTIERYVLRSREYGLGKFPSIFNTRDAAGAVLDFARSGQ